MGETAEQTLQDMMTELTSVVQTLESNENLDLDAALEKYERGRELSSRIERMLADAEIRVELLQADGSATKFPVRLEPAPGRRAPK